MGQITSENDPSAVVERIRLNDSGFQYRLQEEEAADQIHDLEEFDWIAFQTGSYDAYSAGARGGVTHTPSRVDFNNFDPTMQAMLADMQTLRGNDTSNVRYASFDETGFDLFVHEEKSKNDEINHTIETVGWVIADDFLFV